MSTIEKHNYIFQKYLFLVGIEPTTFGLAVRVTRPTGQTYYYLKTTY